MGEVQSKTGQNDLSEDNGLGKIGKHTQAEKHKEAVYGVVVHLAAALWRLTNGAGTFGAWKIGA